jgi:hypothetical protein
MIPKNVENISGSGCFLPAIEACNNAAADIRVTVENEVVARQRKGFRLQHSAGKTLRVARKNPFLRRRPPPLCNPKR